MKEIKKAKGYDSLNNEQKRLLKILVNDVLKIICEEDREKIEIKEVEKYGDGVCCIFENDEKETFTFCKIDSRVFSM